LQSIAEMQGIVFYKDRFFKPVTDYCSFKLKVTGVPVILKGCRRGRTGFMLNVVALETLISFAGMVSRRQPEESLYELHPG
ncbi:hypothetical protein D6779_10735, partial [Candidatus Parcubacteria bacterium]